MHNGGMRSALLVCVLAGCSFEHGEVPRHDSGGPDTPIDMDETGCTSYSSLFDTCTTMMGTSSLILTPGSWTYNTDTHVLSNNGNVMTVASMVINAADGPIDIIFVSTFTLQSGATLRGTSPNLHRPFGIAATGAIVIEGIIDVSAAGSGARTDADCGAATGKPGDDLVGGGGGGGGGAFHGKGGSGSKGNSDGTNSNGGVGGTAIAARPASPIGGCDGGPGGDGMGNGGEGGDGGGAVYLASGTSISISGIIDAGGKFGAAGGQNGDGGGGGGAGGMILLESKTVVVSGIVVANGGGGGEGNTNGNPGESGRRSTQRAKGGADGDANGGDGGEGGAAIENDGSSTTDLQTGGGGGGGGGAGFIALRCPAPTIAATAVFSPDYAPWP
jgi:hypothetical protein